MNDRVGRLGLNVISLTFRVLAYAILWLSLFSITLDDNQNKVIVTGVSHIFYITLLIYIFPVWIESLTRLSVPVWTTIINRKCTLVFTVAGPVIGLFTSIIGFLGIIDHEKLSIQPLWNEICWATFYLAVVFVVVDVMRICDRVISLFYINRDLVES